MSQTNGRPIYTDAWAQRVDSIKGASISVVTVAILGIVLIMMTVQWRNALDELVREAQRRSTIDERIVDKLEDIASAIERGG